MIFSSPLFLWALGLLTIPVIIHLFQFRRFKKVFFPDISLLKEVQTKSKTKNELRHLLVLASRLLFLALLILAFSEPIIPSDQNQSASEHEVVSIYIDNSLSMQSRFEGFDLLAQAKQDAFEIIESYPNETEFQLLTNDFASAQRIPIDKESFISRLDEIKHSPQVRSVNEVLNFRLKSSQEPVDVTTLYLLSDFVGNVDSLIANDDTNRSIRFIKYGRDDLSNISIDSVWQDSPNVQANSETTINVRVRNHSNSPVVDLPLSLEVGGNISSTNLVTIEPMDYTDTLFSIIPSEPGFIRSKLSIEDSPITFDNAFYFTLEVKSSYEILEVSDNRKTSPFEKLFESKEFNYRNLEFSQLRLDSITNPDLVILNAISTYSSGLLTKMEELTNSGKTVLITLPEKLSIETQNDLSKWLNITISSWDTSRLEINHIQEKDRLYSNVFESQPKNLNLPQIYGHWNIKGSNIQSLLSLYNDNPILASVPKAEASVFILTTPLTDATTNFHRHALFVPSILNMPGYNSQKTTPYYTIGNPKVVSRIRKEENFKFLSEMNGNTFIPGVAYDGFLINDQIKKPGFFRVESDSSLLQVIAFNYNREESSTMSLSENEITSIFEEQDYSVLAINSESSDLTTEVSNANFGIELWPLFLLGALILFLIETILIKLFK